MPKYTRIHTLTPEERKTLNEIIYSTSGFQPYGNRARVSVMLTLQNAKFVSFHCKDTGVTPNEFINMVISDMNQLFNNLTIQSNRNDHAIKYSTKPKENEDKEIQSSENK